jgi:hypothetical protein
MDGPAEHVASSADRGVRRRLPRLLPVSLVIAVLVVGYGVWAYTRPAALKEPGQQAAQCVAAKDGGFVTHGTMTIRNTSDHPVEILTLQLKDARGVLITGVPMLVPIRDVVVGNQAGYPPRAANAAADGIELGRQLAVVHGTVPPASGTGDQFNLVVGLSLMSGQQNPSFSSLEMTYKDGRRTRTWNSNTPLQVVTDRDRC